MLRRVSRSATSLGSLCLLGLTLILVVPGNANSPMADPLSLPHLAQRIAHHEQLRIVAFGSSSTEGVGATSPAASYPSQLQAQLTRLLQGRDKVIVLNRGIGGQDADDMAVRISQVIAEHPDLIIWQTGSNDSLRGVPLERFVQETTDGIKQIRAANIDVMLVGPQLCLKLDGEHSSGLYRKALRAIGKDMQVPVIHRHEMMRHWLTEHVLTPEQMLAPDGLHMTDGGYAKLAEAIAQEILHRTESLRVENPSPAD
ncbi:MAG: SGNH/GDSL hydrolase family protein [Acetobacteraceae bacterium]|nr:SGNH/GDSL hydrolase family protein [Acetobacteraceae bacterium]